jgi:hypothetical protein
MHGTNLARFFKTIFLALAIKMTGSVESVSARPPVNSLFKGSKGGGPNDLRTARQRLFTRVSAGSASANTCRAQESSFTSKTRNGLDGPPLPVVALAVLVEAPYRFVMIPYSHLNRSSDICRVFVNNCRPSVMGNQLLLLFHALTSLRLRGAFHGSALFQTDHLSISPSD